MSDEESDDRYDSEEESQQERSSRKRQFNRSRAKRKRAPGRTGKKGTVNEGLNGEKFGKPTDKILGPILYVPGEQFPELEPHIGSYLNVIVLSKHLTTDNEQVKSQKIWGSNPYSEDSDLVCMLQHAGHVTLTTSPPECYALSVYLRLLPGLDEYKASEQNGMKTKSWGVHAVSLQIERVDVIKEETPAIQELLQKYDSRAINGFSEAPDAHTSDTPRSKKTGASAKHSRPRKRESSDAEKDDDSNTSAQPKRVPIQNTTLVWSISNDPCIKYTLAQVCDRGVNPTQWTSYRLKSSVLFLETRFERYEIAHVGTLTQNGIVYDAYRFARVKDPMRYDSETMQSLGLPLSSPDVIEVLGENLDWTDFQWSTTGVKVLGKEYHIKRLFWLPVS